jgi:hypothetical protein
LWRSRADGKLTELADRRAALVAAATEFARHAAAEVLAVDAAERLLMSHTPPA